MATGTPPPDDPSGPPEVVREYPDGVAAFVSRWRLWIMIGLAAVISLMLAVMLVATTLFAASMRHTRDRAPAPEADPGSPPPIPTTTSAASTAPIAETLPPLDGTYRIDANRSRQTYNGVASPQPPDVVTWWALRSVCSPTGCLASGIMLDEETMTPAVDGGALTLETTPAGQWRSQPQTLRFPCVDQGGQADEQTITQTLSLRPTEGAFLRGEMTIDVTSDECDQAGAVIVVPTVAERVDEVPPGVDIPDPVASAAPTPTR